MLTTPNNPSGLVWSKEDLLRLVEILRPHGTWIVADQVYHDFLYDGAKHTYPSKEVSLCQSGDCLYHTCSPKLLVPPLIRHVMSSGDGI